MRYARMLFVGLAVAAYAGAGEGQGNSGQDVRAAGFETRIYVPYGDIARVVAPGDRTVLMDRGEFEALLAKARSRTAEAPMRALGQVVRADYEGEVSQMRYSFSAVMEVVSLSDEPVAVPFMFGGAGLSKVLLDGAAAPLGYDKDGQLVMILTSRGRHEVRVEGTCRLAELPDGGMRFGMSVPEATAGTMRVRMAGDMEVHASVPTASRLYDKAADVTEVMLTAGGRSDLAVVLLGNGRQDDDRAILLGESAASVQLGQRQQALSCLYTVQVLRRGVRDLMFEVPTGWTVTEVSSPSMVKWTLVQENGAELLAVRLRSAKTGTAALHIKALAELPAGTWRGPRVALRDAAYQRGHLLVSTDEGMGLRGERLADARREDVRVTSRVPGLAGLSVGQLYFHWGDRWSVELEPAAIELHRTVKGNQRVDVLTDEIRLTGDFEVTAVDREMYDIALAIAGEGERWDIESVTVDGQTGGFDYRVETAGGRRLIRIELMRPVLPEKVANVQIVLKHVPEGWQWDEARGDVRRAAAVLIESPGRNVSGLVSVSAAGDLEVERPSTDAGMEAVGVGRMASLGLGQDVRYAFEYKEAVKGRVEMEVSRRAPRISAKGSGLISARPESIEARWRLTYTISRASGKRLYLLADRSLGQQIDIQSPNVRLSSKQIVRPGSETMELSSGLAERYNLWMLDLDERRTGDVVVDVSYEQPLKHGRFAAALVRPICGDGVSEQLAIQASEELALEVVAAGAKEIDAVDLDALPVAANRVLAAYRLAAAGAEGEDTVLELSTKVHENYAIPAAIATWGRLTTYVDVRGGQRTEAIFGVVNAGMQFLTMRLPEGAQLWSLAVGEEQARPQRSAEGDYQVSIGRSRTPMAVKVVYAWEPQGADLSALEVGGVELVGVEVNEVQWGLVAPPGYAVVSRGTNLEMRGGAGARPAFLGMWDMVRLGSLGLVRSSKMIMVMNGGRAVMPDGEMAYGPTVGGPLMEQSTDEPVRDLRIIAGAEAPAVQALARVPAPAASPGRPAAAAAPESKIQTLPGPAQQADAAGRRVAARGRYTLPVTLAASGGSTVSFGGLGTGELVVGLKRHDLVEGWGRVGTLSVLLAGMLMLLRPVRERVVLIAAAVFGSALVSVWAPGTVGVANGVFCGAVALVVIYPAVWVVRVCARKIGMFAGGCERGIAKEGKGPVSIQAVLLILWLCGTGAGAQAQTRTEPAAAGAPAVVIPYEGYATEAAAGAKVLVSYARFVELWNQAHPEDPIDKPRPGSDLSLSDVCLEVRADRQRLEVVLAAEVRTYGREWVTIGMPFAGLAVTEARFGGERANLQSGAEGMVLMLAGGAAGKLEICLAGEPQYVGPRGSARFSVPRLPGAVMRVRLADGANLQLEAEGIEGVLTCETEGDEPVWVAAVSMKRDITLRWQPKATDAVQAERQLAAVSDHEVYLFHWATVGVTKIAYDLSAGQYDQFYVLMPEGMTLTDIAGANLRDVRQAGRRSVEGYAFEVLEVNLHRPARQRYEMTVRWIGAAKAGEATQRLLLVRADGVGRESGSVTLHTAGGIGVRVAGVEGGRRMELAAAGAGSSAHESQAAAKYYWPYRPFALFIEVSRPAGEPEVKLDQLVRIDRDRVELLVEARLQTGKGGGAPAFGAVFELPQGFELLSVVGPAVERHYEVQGADGGRRLYVKFAGAEGRTQLAMVMVRAMSAGGELEMPLAAYADEGGAGRRTGRLAVQVARSLDARTVSSRNLKSIAPAGIGDWLKGEQLNAVQFAYVYEEARPSLTLDIRKVPSRMRLETFAGVNVRPTAATYTYRLRYTITGSPVDRLAFAMDSAYAALSVVESAAIRSVSKEATGDGRTVWKLSLVNEVTGTVDVAVNFSVPIDANTTEVIVPRIDGVGPEEVRTVVAVQNTSRHEVRTGEEDRVNLGELPYSEQRKLLSTEILGSLQYVFQTFEREWTLRLTFSPAKEATRIQAVADLVAMTTVIDRAGRSCYEVRVELQNRSEQYLRVRVPDGLRLWSASVADQAVKPVVDTNSAAGEVLIPLVKTSPGGLPYDVVMYLAGAATEPLEGVTCLRPPAISIIGIPVMQTTWSLRLPAGYRYLRPGGNVSAIAGTAEVMSLSLEATLNQMRRLDRTYREMAGVSSRGAAAAKENIAELNKKAVRQMQQYGAYFHHRGHEIGGQELERLRTKLDEQRRMQQQILAGNAEFARQQEAEGRNDLNWFLNTSADNTGMAEAVRNSALLEKPEFVGYNQRVQMERLATDLAKYEVAMGAAPTDQAAVQARSGSSKERVSELVGGLSTEGRASNEDVAAVLDSVMTLNAVQMQRDASQVRAQLDVLRDNRGQRYFDGQNAAHAKAQSPADVRRPGEASRAPAYGGGIGVQREDALLRVGAAREAGAAGAVLVGGMPGGGAVSQAAVYSNETMLGFGGYVAGGTYSLPVSLPLGGVRLDFARPGGDAVLVLWAVPEAAGQKLVVTAALAVAAALVIVAIRLWPQIWACTRRRAAVYIVIFLVLVVMLGVVGLIAAAGIVGMIELQRCGRKRAGTAK